MNKIKEPILKKSILTFALFFAVITSQSQQIVSDSIFKNETQKKDLPFHYTALIVPAVLIGYGVIGIGSDQLITFNNGIKDEVTEHIDKKITIDDFSQYAPAVSVYALNLVGAKGKNNFKDRTVILATSFIVMATTVTALKHIVKEERPDKTSNNSFPSGHTATAFAGAELLYQEYKDVSVWYGISGYIVATGTGIFRVYNNRHWLTDVAAGAGIGILSTKLAYWVHPYLKSKFRFLNSSKTTAMFTPYYDGKKTGIGFAMSF